MIARVNLGHHFVGKGLNDDLRFGCLPTHTDQNITERDRIVCGLSLTNLISQLDLRNRPRVDDERLLS